MDEGPRDGTSVWVGMHLHAIACKAFKMRDVQPTQGFQKSSGLRTPSPGFRITWVYIMVVLTSL